MEGDRNNSFEEGRCAALQGRRLAENPYPPGSNNHAYWVLGYDSITWPADEM